MIIGDQGPLVTADEAASILRVPEGTIRRWVSEDQIRSFGRRRSLHWRFEDLCEALARRRTESREVDNTVTSAEDTDLT